MSDSLSRRNQTGSSDPEQTAANDGGGQATDETPDVFLSYSRTDQPVVLRITAALEAAGWSVWIDREDVPPASEWREELALGIRTTHTFVFVVSKDSVRSDYCRWELGEAVQLGKRLIPVVIDEVADAPEQLASRQYVFARPGDDFEQAVSTLTTALATDLDWVREHRHWLLEAIRWDSHDRDRSLLVRGRDLKQAEAWFSRQGANLEPRPTELQAQYLLASRAWETRRTQIVTVAVAVALVVTIVLGIATLLQRNRARDQAATARSRELAIAADSQVGIDPQRSLLLAKEAVSAKATAEADNALRRALRTNHLLAAIPVRAKRIGALVNDVAFSPDGKRVAAVAKGGTVLVADADGAGEPTVLASPRRKGDLCSNAAGAALYHVTFSRDGTRVAAADDFGRITIWRLSRPNAPVTSPFCLGRATPPTALDLLSVLTKGATFPPAALAFASGDAVELVESDGDVTRWRWRTDSKPTVVSRGGGSPVAAAFSDDAAVAAVARDDSVQFRPRGSSAWQALPLRDVHAIAVSGDGSTIAAVAGGSIVVSRPGESTGVRTLRAPATVRAVALNDGGDALAIGDSRNAIRIWDLTRHTAAPTLLAGSGGPVTALAFSPDGRRLVSGSDDGVVRVWASDAGGQVRAQLVSDGRLLALSAQSPTRGWILVDGARRLLTGLPTVVNELSVSRDAGRAAVAAALAESRAALLWDTSDEVPQPRQITFRRGVNGVAVSPDGSRLAVAERRTFRVVPWLSTDGQVLASSDALEYTTPTFSPDGRRVAVAAYTGKSSTVLVWNVGSGRAPIRRFGALGGVTDIDFSADGNTLVAAASDGAVRVLDVEGTSPPVVLRGHEGPANGVGISPDGSEIVSGGSDGSVRVWERATGKDVAFDGPGGPIIDVAFTTGGTRIVASSTEGTRVYSCGFCGSTSDVLARADRATTRELTAAERALYLHER